MAETRFLQFRIVTSKGEDIPIIVDSLDLSRQFVLIREFMELMLDGPILPELETMPLDIPAYKRSKDGSFRRNNAVAEKTWRLEDTKQSNEKIYIDQPSANRLFSLTHTGLMAMLGVSETLPCDYISETLKEKDPRRKVEYIFRIEADIRNMSHSIAVSRNPLFLEVAKRSTGDLRTLAMHLDLISKSCPYLFSGVRQAEFYILGSGPSVPVIPFSVWIFEAATMAESLSKFSSRQDMLDFLRSRKAALVDTVEKRSEVRRALAELELMEMLETDEVAKIAKKKSKKSSTKGKQALKC